MDFSGISDEEIQKYTSKGQGQSDFVLKEERCKYTVIEANDHTSKEGKSSIRIKMQAEDSTNKKAKVFCYLTGAKLIKFLDSHGMVEAISARKINPEQLINKSGVFQNKHEMWQGETKNSVHYFVKVTPVTPMATDDFDNEDIPF